jgi:hypothetical protein
MILLTLSLDCCRQIYPSIIAAKQRGAFSKPIQDIGQSRKWYEDLAGLRRSRPARKGNIRSSRAAASTAAT